MNEIELVRIARLWMEDGPNTMPDRTLADALAEVHVTNQRRRGPLEGVRSMKIVYALAASFAGIILAVAAASLLGRPLLQSVGGPTKPILTLSTEPVVSIPAIGLAFSPDGRSVFAGRGWHNESPVASIHDATTGAVISDQEPAPDGWGVVAFSPDGALVALGTDGTDLYDMTSGGPPTAEFDECCLATFSPDGRYLGTLNGNVYDVGSGTLVNDTPFVGDVTFSPDGTRMLLSGRADETWVTDQVAEPPFGPGAIGTIVNALDQDDRTLLRLEGEGGVRAWNILGSGAAWSPDGTMVAIPTAAGSVLVWDARTGERLFELQGSPGEQGTWTLLTAVFSPDSRWLATGSNVGAVSLWDLRDPDAEPISRLGVDRSAIFSIAYNPDGTRLLTGHEDEASAIWGVDGL